MSKITAAPHFRAVRGAGDGSERSDAVKVRLEFLGGGELAEP